MVDAMEKRSPKGVKRRNERNILTFYEKIAVIRYYEDTNISRNSLAKMFHCCTTQIRRILDRKQELLQQLNSLSETDATLIIEEMTRKRRKFEMSAISFILHQWVERCRQLRLRSSITNQTLKDTALKMAAILNLPAFRPSYRWLNRFRGKYKYNDEDLRAGGGGGATGELAVEDIIIEFKDSLPSFMQKEISAITSSPKLQEKLTPNGDGQRNEVTLYINENSVDYDLSDGNDEVDEDTRQSGGSPDLAVPCATEPLDPMPVEAELADQSPPSGSASALLNNVFPHLAIIHQFAMFNSDVRAVELISQLGVHLQAQAAKGAYQALSLETPNATPEDHDADADAIYGDLDDIVLIE